MATRSPARIHVLFKTHLDIGFTDLARNVFSLYVTRFIPQAISLARELREKHGRPRFIWTTGAWLIHRYLEEASPKARREMEAAIAAGDIVWHGLPFTSHTELLDPSLFRFGLGLAAELDLRFGRETVAAKMTDVPGHTRAMVPLLAEAGIRFLHLGVNPASMPPAVPKAFRWIDPSGAEVLVVYAKGDYGGLSQFDQIDEALYFAHTGDNLGPCSAADVEEVYRRLERRFPQAEVVASTLDAFASAIVPHREKFPMVTGEIGDTWIHGVGTDPQKVSLFRALSRWRAGLKNPTAPELAPFSRQLMMVAEHTWGLDVKVALGHEETYDREFRTRQFQKKRRTAPYLRLEKSWAEQRGYLTDALRALRGTGHEKEVAALVRSLRPRVLRAGKKIAAGKKISTSRFEIAFDPETGALSHLRHAGRDWAGQGNRIGLAWYEIFSAADYEGFRQDYNRNHEKTHNWAVPDFLKPGVEKAVKAHQAAIPRLHSLTRTGEGRFLVEAGFDPVLVRDFGCPKRLQVEVLLSEERPEIEFTVQWFEKQASRVPEAFWFSICPKTAPKGAWSLSKLGSRIDPRTVVRDGNRTLHAVEGAHYADAKGTLDIDNPDAPLIAPGHPSLVHFTNLLPKPGEGVHFNLHNNTWGTNFPLWYEDDARFRFTLRFG